MYAASFIFAQIWGKNRNEIESATHSRIRKEESTHGVISLEYDLCYLQVQSNRILCQEIRIRIVKLREDLRNAQPLCQYSQYHTHIQAECKDSDQKTT